MLDRAIAIIGIAVTVITGLLQYYLPHLPSWLAAAGFLVGFFLLGLSVGLFSAGGTKRKRARVKTAFLQLHIFGDNRMPQRLELENIFRWYYLQTGVDNVGPSGRIPLGTFVTLFVTFEPEVEISTLRVSSPDIQLPRYEVKDFNQRFAIIFFTERLPAGTLEVRVAP